MTSLSNWKVAPAAQPSPGDYAYDLHTALSSMVGLRTTIPVDAFTAETLGTERAGYGVVIDDKGIVLTIGYLLTEADAIWLHLNDGRAIAGHALAYDQETGFGLVQALGRLELPALPIGRSSEAQPGQTVVIAGAGGRTHSIAGRIVGRQEFAGYWEYVLDDAIFTAPAHPHWGGTALISAKGELIGIGSLQLEQSAEQGESEQLNMVVPIDLLKPIYNDMLKFGRPNRAARPWLGLFSTEMEDKIVVVGVAKDGPAQRAKLRTGDVLLSVGAHEPANLADFYRHVWSLGSAGIEVPLTIYRDGRTLELSVTSGDRNRFLKSPRLH